MQNVPHGGARSNPRKLRRDFIQHKMILKSFCKSQFPQKIVNLFFTLVMVKAKFTDLCGNRLLQDDFMNTFCEMRLAVFAGRAARRDARRDLIDPPEVANYARPEGRRS